MEKVVFRDLEVLYKYCVNRISYNDFRDMMMEIYPGSEDYVKGKWPIFRDDPLGFIVSRSETELLASIYDKMPDDYMV